MKAIVQRVSSASVCTDGEIIGNIDKGFVVLIGVGQEDTKDDVNYLVKKVTGLRIFEDENNKMNLSLKDVGGELLVISQFTLFADTKKGNRPSFINAGPAELSKDYYKLFISECQKLGYQTKEGRFGAHMDITLIADGPVTISIDSRLR